MNFTEIVAEVLSNVKRPDKLSMIRREVNAAILYLTQEEDYRRDLVEFAHPIAPASHEAIIPLTAFTRFRKISYMKIGGTKHYLEELSSLKIETNCDMRNKWYLAGSSINAMMSMSTSSIDIGYYQFPPYLTDASPEYWMLELNWPAIVDRATAKVFIDIGDPPSAERAMAASNAAALMFKFDQKRGGKHDGG